MGLDLDLDLLRVVLELQVLVVQGMMKYQTQALVQSPVVQVAVLMVVLVDKLDRLLKLLLLVLRPDQLLALLL